jgi:hypothetical protein
MSHRHSDAGVLARRRFNGQARNIVAVESKTVGYR